VIKPRTPAGTLELLPGEQRTFNHMLEVIRRNYERFGFLPIETPVFELSEVLLTKTGGETERQVYFVQSTGALEQGGAPELALRFDLTVPLARYVAEHEHQLAFPFRRAVIRSSGSIAVNAPRKAGSASFTSATSMWSARMRFRSVTMRKFRP